MLDSPDIDVAVKALGVLRNLLTEKEVTINIFLFFIFVYMQAIKIGQFRG